MDYYEGKPTIMVANIVTGEVWEGLADSAGIRAIVSRVKEQIYNGQKAAHINVIKGSYKTIRYIKEVARGQELTYCDFCDGKPRNKDMHYLHDNNDVCMLGICNTCYNKNGSDFLI